jgi:hypothetical protein
VSWKDWQLYGSATACRGDVTGFAVGGERQPWNVHEGTLSTHELLGISFAVAVHRARLREWAHIYKVERAELIKKAEAAQTH